MANQEHVDMLLRDGVASWNQWRKENPGVQPDLRDANLRDARLIGADLSCAALSRADLRNADLTAANLNRADLIRADLTSANCQEADLTWTDLRDANLRDANLSGADLNWAELSGAALKKATLIHADLSCANLMDADLSGAHLGEAICVETNLSGATLTGCIAYGVLTWDTDLEGATQADLRITYASDEVNITVDNLETAHFLYLLLHNQKMRALLDTITSKVVLILGRFSDERKPVLDALREALRRHPNGYIPVLFDFEPQTDKPVLETVKTLANLARFVIADLTDPHMVRAELTAIIPNVPTVPIQPLIQGSADLPTEYESWALYRSVLPVYRYSDLSGLLANLNGSVITPVETHVQARRL